MDTIDDPWSGLKPVTLEDQKYFQTTFQTIQQPISDYSFASVFIWGKSLEVHWATIENHLCIFANSTGDLTMLLPPIACANSDQSDLTACLQACFEIMDRYNDRYADRSRSRIEYVSDEVLERLNVQSKLPLGTNPMSGDYIYDMARMIDLAGGAYSSKRHDRERFRRRHPLARTTDFTAEDVPACLQLLEQWRGHGDATHTGETNEHDVRSEILRAREYVACHAALQHVDALGLRGMLLWDDQTLVGFTLGETLSPAQASIVIEKTLPGCSGSAQFIFSEFCRQYWSNYPECNVGDDWGLPSLRFTKQSYRPVRILSKYSLSRQYIPVQVAVPSFVETTLNTQQMNFDSVEAAVAISSDSSPQFRRACMEDVQAVLGLEHLCFSSPEESFHRRQVRNLIRNPRAQVYVAEQDGVIQAWSVGLIRRHKTGTTGRLYAVAVRPEARGHHLGQKLVEYTLEKLAELGARRIYLQVRENNVPAINLYNKLGFMDRGHLRDYYATDCHARSMMKEIVLATVAV